MQKYTKKTKKRKDKGEYFKKDDLFFDFCRYFATFANKIANYEEETIHHPVTDGSYRAA